MPRQNRSIHLINYPVGLPKIDTDFALVTIELPDTLEDGQVLFKTLYLSVDPYMRGRMRNVPSYFPCFQLHKPLDVGSIVEVAESKSEKFKVGDIFTGLFDASDYVLLNENDPKLQGNTTQNITYLRDLGLPITTAQSCIGMVGLTAYFGLLDICKPKEGETVVVSGAAGAVGTLVGQIAKIKGCKVIGIAGGAEKVRFITEELGFDAGIDYKASNLKEALKAAAPNGVDIYFDNVGGEITDTVMQLMNRFGRISKCGAISGYNAEEVVTGPVHDWTIITKSLLIQGFIVSDWAKRFPEGLKQLTEWVASKKIKYRETLREGLENYPKTFIEMLTGANIGKMLLKAQ